MQVKFNNEETKLLKLGFSYAFEKNLPNCYSVILKYVLKMRKFRIPSYTWLKRK